MPEGRAKYNDKSAPQDCQTITLIIVDTPTRLRVECLRGWEAANISGRGSASPPIPSSKYHEPLPRATSHTMYCPGPLAERTMPLTRCSRSVTPTRFVISAKSF